MSPCARIIWRRISRLPEEAIAAFSDGESRKLQLALHLARLGDEFLGMLTREMNLLR